MGKLCNTEQLFVQPSTAYRLHGEDRDRPTTCRRHCHGCGDIAKAGSPWPNKGKNCPQFSFCDKSQCVRYSENAKVGNCPPCSGFQNCQVQPIENPTHCYNHTLSDCNRCSAKNIPTRSNGRCTPCANNYGRR